MLMAHLAYVPNIQPEILRIEDQEAHHLLNVLRLKKGDLLQVFDGCGQVAETQILATTRRNADVRVLSRTTCPESAMHRITVAAAPAKGDRLRWMVEKLTELGVARLVLLQTSRTVVNLGETKLEKLQSYVIGACKQSGRMRLMEITGLSTLDEVLHLHSKSNEQLVLAHPTLTDSESVTADAGAAIADCIDRRPDNRSSELLLIGPEGGFSDEEIAKIRQHQPRQIIWPENILRIETAAVVFSTMLLMSKNAEA